MRAPATSTDRNPRSSELQPGGQTDVCLIRSLTLMRTPKYEFTLDDSERGVSVSDEDRDEDDADLLEEIEFRGDDVRIVSRNTDYQLDCSRVDPEEVEDAKQILRAMNFDSRFRIHVS